MFEQVKDYKSACKVLGIKPIDKRRKLDGSTAGFFLLASSNGLGGAAAGVDTHLRFISEDAAEYAAKTFKPLYMKHIFGID